MNLPRCANGHLLFDTQHGLGCLAVGCPSRVVNFDKPKPKKKKAKAKPKEKTS